MFFKVEYPQPSPNLSVRRLESSFSTVFPYSALISPFVHILLYMANMEFCIDFSDIDCCRHTFPCLSDKVNNFLKQVVYFLIVCDDVFAHKI